MEENRINNSENITPINDSDLANVSGGAEKSTKVTAYCPKCKKKQTVNVFSGTRGYCSVCNTPVEV